MTQSHAMIQALKKILRQQGKTYKDVAEHLDLSEASVKRLFADQSFTLERFEKICDFVAMEFAELAAYTQQQIELTKALSYEQEKELVSDIKLLLITVCLINNWQLSDITKTYQIEPLEAIQLAAKLDRMKIIQLLPGDKVKRMIDNSFSWLANGPIQRFFEKHVQSDFFQSHFNGPGELRVFVNGMLSRQSNQEMNKKIQRLVQEFNFYQQQDETLPVADRFGTSLLLAMRPWEVDLFTKLRREQDTKSF